MSEPRLLSDIPWDNIQVGDRLVSSIGTPGRITSFNPQHDVGRERGWCSVEWKNGNNSEDAMLLSDVPWFGTKIVYLGRVNG